jgi:RecJ-like exonuclease
MIKCRKCKGATGSTDHERCRECGGLGEVSVPCDSCGERIASVDMGGVYLCCLCYEIRLENEREEQEQ